MFQDQVFCFTPKGELISLPRGSTPVDFAYAVHSAIGNSCVGAKVNGRHVPLRHRLDNGDQVDILRSKAQRPSPRWESFVVTGKARSSIRRFVRKQQRAEYRILGKDIIDHAFQQQGLEFSEKALKEAPGLLKLRDIDNLYEQVGAGHLTARQLLRALYPRKELKPMRRPTAMPVRAWDPEGSSDNAVPILGLTPGVVVHLADCCHPLPGDRIVGILDPGEGAIIHTSDCEELQAKADTADDWLDVSWQSRGEKPAIYTGRVKLIVMNEAGALAKIAQTVAKQGGNIANLKITDRDPEFYTMLVDIEVRNLKHLTDTSTSLRGIDVVSSADRVRG